MFEYLIEVLGSNDNLIMTYSHENYMVSEQFFQHMIRTKIHVGARTIRLVCVNDEKGNRANIKIWDVNQRKITYEHGRR